MTARPLVAALLVSLAAPACAYASSRPVVVTAPAAAESIRPLPTQLPSVAAAREPVAVTPNAAKRRSHLDVDPCGAGPRGYRLDRGYPVRSKDRNPQTAALYLQDVLRSTRWNSQKRACLTTRAARAIVADAQRRGNAMLFRYHVPYDFGAAGRIEPVWSSGLAQTTMAGSLLSIAELSGDESFARDARAAMEPVYLPLSRGGFRHEIAGGAWIQEYPSAVPSFVLNGHLFSIMSSRSFAERTGDARARRVFDRGVRAVDDLLPLFDIPSPGGAVSAYDLIRRRPGAALRVAGAELTDAAFVTEHGRVVLRPGLDALARGVRPQYPLSVVDVPRLFLRVTYRGSGDVRVLDGSAWRRLAVLPATNEPVSIEIPQRFQGRTVNLSYHRIHVDLLRRLARATGQHQFDEWARRWNTSRP